MGYLKHDFQKVASNPIMVDVIFPAQLSKVEYVKALSQLLTAAAAPRAAYCSSSPCARACSLRSELRSIAQARRRVRERESAESSRGRPSVVVVSAVVVAAQERMLSR